MKNVQSFTAASSFPLKVVQSAKDIIDEEGRIKPYHVQLNPTNVCNLKCSFCSCANREKTDVLPLSVIQTTMEKYYALGCRAVTITGGGEPLLHPQINELLRIIKAIGIKIGLVTNGTVLHRLKAFESITWCRISSEDTRQFNASLINTTVHEHPEIDWAFSHVVSIDPNMKLIASVVDFANNHNFTHVRLVSDLFNTDKVPMQTVKQRLRERGIDDSRVIYQVRNDSVKGAKKCFVSLLKPVIGACGGIYPCCGVQYANETPSLDLHAQMRIGTVKDIKTIFSRQEYFDGSVCAVCYYDSYNQTLGSLIQKLDHKEFV